MAESGDRLVCDTCKKEGMLYMFEGKPYCPDCLTAIRPPLKYRGVERRKAQMPTYFRRREK